MGKEKVKPLLGAKLDPPEVERKKVFVRYVTPSELPRLDEIVSEEVEKVRKMLKEKEKAYGR